MSVDDGLDMAKKKFAWAFSSYISVAKFKMLPAEFLQCKELLMKLFLCFRDDMIDLLCKSEGPYFNIGGRLRALSQMKKRKTLISVESAILVCR